MKRLLILWAVLMITACASTPTSLYVLNQADYVLPQNRPQQILLEVHLAEHLQTQRIIYEVANNQLHFANNHLWATDLSLSLAKVFANGLNQNQQMIAYRINGNDYSNKLIINIEKLQGSFTGKVTVAGYAQLLDNQGKQLKMINFSQEIKQVEDGYPALVNAVNKALEQVIVQLR